MKITALRKFVVDRAGIEPFFLFYRPVASFCSWLFTLCCSLMIISLYLWWRLTNCPIEMFDEQLITNKKIGPHSARLVRVMSHFSDESTFLHQNGETEVLTIIWM